MWEYLKEQWLEAPLGKKLFLVALLTFLTGYTVYTVAVKQKQQQVNRLKISINNLHYQITNLKGSVSPQLIPRLEKKLKQLKEELEHLKERETALPKESKVEEILTAVSTGAEENSFTINEFKVSKAEKVYITEENGQVKLSKKRSDRAVPINRVEVSIQLEGESLDGIVRLIKHLYSQGIPLTVDRLNIQTGKGESPLQVKINLSTFYKGDKR
ncbi:MAG: hypothetical protein GXO45_03675 [Aquificae bacterium]|nr:hypothetical protein [Aquificota bacterium]